MADRFGWETSEDNNVVVDPEKKKKSVNQFVSIRFGE